MKNIVLPSRYRRLAAARGFTLVEMVLVLGIIGLLLGAAIYQLTGVMDAGRLKRVNGDITAISAGLRTYEVSAGFLPSTEQGINALVERPSARPAPPAWTQVMKKLPMDPWGNKYNYRKPGTHDKGGFDLYSSGPDGLPDTADDIGNWEQ